MLTAQLKAEYNNEGHTKVKLWLEARKYLLFLLSQPQLLYNSNIFQFTKVATKLTMKYPPENHPPVDLSQWEPAGPGDGKHLP
jgi:hypothetical protein